MDNKEQATTCRENKGEFMKLIFIPYLILIIGSRGWWDNGRHQVSLGMANCTQWVANGDYNLSSNLRAQFYGLLWEAQK